jgi:hypothetical protein
MFGSLTEAYRRAGLKARPRSYTDKEILSAIEKLVKEKGRMPTARELIAASKAGKVPTVSTIYRNIGNLPELKARFGFIDKKS